MVNRIVGALILATILAAPAAVVAQAISPEAVKLAEAGSKALDERRLADALSAFTAAAKLAPRSAEIAFGVGLSAYMLGQNAEAERQFQRALQLDPALNDASLLLGELQYRSGRIRDAVATYEAALKSAPGDARLKEKISQWSAEARTESRFAETRGVHFRALFEGPVDQGLARRAVDLLEATYRRIGDSLQFYPTESIEVVLYTSQQFRDITRGPTWAGGVYDGRIRVPVKGALDQIDELERVLAARIRPRARRRYRRARSAGVGERRVGRGARAGRPGRCRAGRGRRPQASGAAGAAYRIQRPARRPGAAGLRRERTAPCAGCSTCAGRQRS